MENKKGLFITATGTDVGKTYVTALLVKKLRESGINAGYYKAALSGAFYESGALMAGDSAYVVKTASIPAEPNSLVSYLFEPAVSPHLAAQMAQQPIEESIILRDFLSCCEQFDCMTVEGSGGIVCPLRLDKKSLMLTDIIRLLGLPVLIIASAGLGTINSTVLTVEHAKAKGIAVKGIILNWYEQANRMHRDNKAQLERLTGCPVVATVSKDADSLESDVDALYRLYGKIECKKVIGE